MLQILKSYYRPKVLNIFEDTLPGSFAVFGTGLRGRRCAELLRKVGIGTPCFIDNDVRRQGTVIDGTPVISPEEFRARHKDCPVIICSWDTRTILGQLLDLGCFDVYIDRAYNYDLSKVFAQRIKELTAIYEMLEDNDSKISYTNAILNILFNNNHTYYSTYGVYRHPMTLPVPGDCIIDGGAASGDLLDFFQDSCGGDCTVYAFEPTPQLFSELSQTIRERNMTNVRAVNMALWDKPDTLYFCDIPDARHANYVAPPDKANMRVTAIDIDGFVAENGIAKVDFIKLDVECSELKVLTGARKTIARHRPKLLICLYHQPQDLWELPLFVAREFPGYKMYAGLHSCCHLDLVLYCVPA